MPTVSDTVCILLVYCFESINEIINVLISTSNKTSLTVATKNWRRHTIASILTWQHFQSVLLFAKLTDFFFHISQTIFGQFSYFKSPENRKIDQEWVNSGVFIVISYTLRIWNSMPDVTVSKFFKNFIQSIGKITLKQFVTFMKKESLSGVFLENINSCTFCF